MVKKRAPALALTPGSRAWLCEVYKAPPPHLPALHLVIGGEVFSEGVLLPPFTSLGRQGVRSCVRTSCIARTYGAAAPQPCDSPQIMRYARPAGLTAALESIITLATLCL